MVNKNVPARKAGKGDGSKPLPKVKPPTYPPVSPGNPASLSAFNVQGSGKVQRGYSGGDC